MVADWYKRPSWWAGLRDETAWRLKQIAYALRIRCKCEGNYTLNRLQRWWYTYKAIICVALGRTHITWRDDSISVAMWDFRKWHGPEWTSYDWRELVVAMDSWNARVEVNGAP